jgi:uncharacterized Zn-binding protein involved in type VI secretion
MANNVQVVGDPDTGGGLVETPLQDFYFASQKLISVNGTPVTDHDDHTGVVTANGSNFFNIKGIPLNFFGNADSCGHTRAGTQVPWFIIGS